MGRKRITLDQLGAALTEILTDYSDGVYAAQQKAVTASTRQALREVKAASGKFGGKYAGGWRSRIEKGNLYSTGICYNTRPGLPHLLEFGHALTRSRRPGAKKRTSAYPHVLPAQTAVNKILMQKLEESLK